jgi:CubicO group peptidase (beta-lactamase class C family)
MGAMRYWAFFAATAFAMSAGIAGAQTPPPAPPSPQDSDPVALGWMVGSPPPPEKQVRFEDGSFYAFPRTRWSFAHYRELMPTARVARGAGPAARLPVALRTDIDALTFSPLGGGAPMRWDAAFEAVYGDAILVLHRGRIVYERYAGVMHGDQPHIAFSVTKSFFGTLTEMLIAEGKIDETARVVRYIPELAGSAFGDATVRQVLDMTTGLDYSEDYADPKAHIAAFAAAAGLSPRPPGYAGPKTSYDYLRTVAKKGNHGDAFAYKSVNTEVLGWLIARVTGERPQDVLSKRIWSRIGAEHDADIVVDSAGMPFAAGGLNATLRDMARFGEMIRLGGRFNGQQIVPAAVVKSMAAGASKDDFAKAGYKTLPGWSYRSQWWVSHNSHGAFAARGIHGQTIYIDPKAEMVIVRFASNPRAANSNFDPISLPAYQAVAEHLMATRGKARK